MLSSKCLDFVFSCIWALSENVPDLLLRLGSLNSAWEKVHRVSYEIARQVVHVAFKERRCWLSRMG